MTNREVDSRSDDEVRSRPVGTGRVLVEGLTTVRRDRRHKGRDCVRVGT